MRHSVYVKVIGFRDVERHALNTLFRLSCSQSTTYALWTPEAPVAPQLALFDLEVEQAGIELSAPDLDPQLKIICVGHGAPAHASCTFERPLYWPDVVNAMDHLSAPLEKLDDGIDFSNDDWQGYLPPGFRVSLLVDPSLEDRLYLRARLALANQTDVDEAATAAQALELANKRHYDLVIVALALPDMEGLELVRQLVSLEPAIGRVVASSSDQACELHELAERAGCSALLVKPFDPLQIVRLL
jgi:CheY-like chemotaxis protein